MALCPQCTAQKVGSRACLHANQRHLQVRRERNQLSLAKLLLQQHFAVFAKSYQVKGGLPEIDANRMYLHVVSLLK